MNSFDIYKQKAQNGLTYKNLAHNKPKSTTIKGFLADTYIKNNDVDMFDLSINYNESIFDNQKKETKKETFNMENAIKPLVILTGASLLGIIGISSCIKKYSDVMAKTQDLVRPGDLARSINIVEEPHLAMYRALRDPSAKNVLGLIGVAGFSLLALSAKNCVEGIKEVWIKKQNCDIEYDYRQNLIDIEASAFKGKLGALNNTFEESKHQFRDVLNFKGNKKEEKKKQKNPLPLIIVGALGFSALSGMLFKNYQKIVGNLDTFKNRITDTQIKSRIQSALQNSDKQKAIEQLSNILKLTNANEKMMEENFSKIESITPKEIQEAIRSIKNAQIYAQAPEALGGISEKIQYYCYVNEERGHLYNWILNPENKFNKYLFLSFCFVSSVGYLARTCVDAIKQVAVTKENTNSELNLKKRLVEVEINNFRTKKICAVAPLVEKFKQERKKGANKQELNELAQAVLHEIKNGPPYIYD